MAYPRNPSLLGPLFHALDHPPTKYIASIISPLAGKTSSHVLNSKHFAETMRDITVGEDELLVSFYVSSLFTNVPIGEAVQVIQAKLREDDSLTERSRQIGWQSY